MPVPAEVETKQESTESSNGAPPAPSASISTQHINADANSLGSQEENGVASNGSPSPVNGGTTNGDGDKPQ